MRLGHLSFWAGQEVGRSRDVALSLDVHATPDSHVPVPAGLGRAVCSIPCRSQHREEIGLDWYTAGQPMTAGGLDMTQNHVDLLSGKVDAVPTRQMRRRSSAPASASPTCGWGITTTRASKFFRPLPNISNRDSSRENEEGESSYPVYPSRGTQPVPDYLSAWTYFSHSLGTGTRPQGRGRS